MKSIAFNEKRIRSRVKKFSNQEAEVLFREMTEEIFQLFQERRSILKMIFHELEKLPKTKAVLFEENLIIECLKDDLIHRKILERKTANKKISAAVQDYMSILISKVIEKSEKPEAVKAELLHSLKTHLSSE